MRSAECHMIMAATISLVVVACVAGVVLGGSPGPDRPDITVLYRYDRICVAGPSTNGYGLAFMSEKLYDQINSDSFVYQSAHRYAPKIDTIGNCDFEDINGCWKNWSSYGLSLESSGSYPLSPVTDERWNNFKIFETYTWKSYDPGNSIDINENFFISFSIRSIQDAQIFLKAWRDETYWIIIDGLTTNFDRTGIRKCVKGVDRWTTDDNCKLLRNNITTPEKLLHESHWTHFMLSREDGNRIRLWQWDLDTGARPLLDYTDDDPISITTMRITSNNSIANWKMHTYKFVKIHYKKDVFQLGPPFSFERSSAIHVCVSLKVAMCSHCKMELTVQRADETIELQSSIEGDSNNTDGVLIRWQNVRMQGKVSTSRNNYYLIANLSTKHGNVENGFWAIDDFRKCSNNEIRRAEVNVDYNKSMICQSLKNPDWIINSDREVEHFDPPICSDIRYTGRYCNVSCEFLFWNDIYCSVNKICLPTPIGSKEGGCTCGAGYTWESNCTKQCTRGDCGFKCADKCGKCKGNITCNADGSCPYGCEDGYLPPNCNLTPSEIDKVNILEITDTEVILSWKEPKEKNGDIHNYTVTYELLKRIGCKDKPIPQSCNITVLPSEISKVKISDLQPYSTYNITVAADTTIPGREKRFQFNTTMTSVIGDKELPATISIPNLSARSVTISWPVNCLNQRGPLFFKIVLKCEQDAWCDQIQDIVLDNINSLNGGTNTHDLTPFANYSVELRAKRSRNGNLTTFNRSVRFYTPAASPPAVRNFAYYSKDAQSVSLRWQKPYPPHGHLQDYFIKSCHTNSCEEIQITTNDFTPCDLWNEQFSCFKLLTTRFPNTQYRINITASNTESPQQSPESSLTVLTAEDKSTAPLNLTREWEHNAVKLFWNHPDVTNGQLKKFIITLNKTDIKPESRYDAYSFEYIISEEMKSYSYMINNSYQYSSSYMVTICGVNSFYGENGTLHIDTPPETPKLSGDGNVAEEKATNTTVTIKIPGVKKETISQVSFLYIVVNKINSVSKTNFDEANDLKKAILKYVTGHAWIAKEIIGLNERQIEIHLGTEESTASKLLNETIVNQKLEPSTTYEIIVLLINTYKNNYSIKDYHLNVSTASNSRYRPELLSLLLLLLLPVVIYFVYRYIKRRRNSDRSGAEQAEEHPYRPLDNPTSHQNVVPQQTSNDNPQEYERLIENI